MGAAHEERVTVASGALALDGALRRGTEALAALVLHPHPLYGGDMDNHVVLALCDAFARRGATTLRYNSRGAGGSDGAFDGGRGEADDAVAAKDVLLAAAAPGSRLIVAGYSFGALVAAGGASRTSPGALVLVSPPTNSGRFPALPDGVPALLITGDRDAVAPVPAVRALEAPGRTVVIVPGVDHGWWPGTEQLREALAAFLDALVETA